MCCCSHVRIVLHLFIHPESENLHTHPERRCWSALKSGLSADEIANAHDVMLERMDAEFATLKRLESLVTAAEATFVGACSAKEMDPAATVDAVTAENAQVRGPLFIRVSGLLCARLLCRGDELGGWPLLMLKGKAAEIELASTKLRST
jgi:hypothetical protein